MSTESSEIRHLLTFGGMRAEGRLAAQLWVAFLTIGAFWSGICFGPIFGCGSLLSSVCGM